MTDIYRINKTTEIFYGRCPTRSDRLAIKLPWSVSVRSPHHWHDIGSVGVMGKPSGCGEFVNEMNFVGYNLKKRCCHCGVEVSGYSRNMVEIEFETVEQLTSARSDA